MKNIIYSFFLIVSTSLFAQVGIKTTTPQEELHLGDATSTIRVEGLNATNNVANLGTQENTRVYVDTDGDLVLATEPTEFEILFNPDNYLDDPLDTGGANENQILQTGTGSGYSNAGWPRNIGPGSSTFTLTRNAIVEINYSLSYETYKNNTSNIDDHHARTVQFYIYLRNGSHTGPIVTTDVDGDAIGFAGDVGALGYSGQFYTNGSGSDGATGREGYDKTFYATGHDYVKLGPGTYSPMFAGIMFVANTAGAGSAKMQIGGGGDEVIVIAHYYD